MSHPDPDFHVRLGRQSLRRPLSTEEAALAKALEQIFAGGEHDFARVAEALTARGVAKPSGAGGAWTIATLQAELERINADLDEAYATRPLMPAARAPG